MSAVELSPGGTARTLSLRLSTSACPINIFRVNTPMLYLPDKDQFYEELDNAIRGIPPSEYQFLLDNLGARVGSDHDSWSSCLGHVGIGRLNQNGQRLLELCSYHDLCITNTFYSTKPIDHVSWHHPRSHHCHQLDLVITHRPTLNHILIPHSYRGADCDTDHSLVGSKVHIQLKIIYQSKQKGRPRINSTRTAISDLCTRFAQSIEEAFKDSPAGSIEGRWGLHS